jgi:hypothetical protein
VFPRVRAKLSDIAASLDGFSQRLASTARTWALWPALYAIASGTALWEAKNPKSIATLDGNKLPLKETNWLLVWVLSSLAAIALVHFITMVVRRRRTGRWEVLSTIAELNGKLAPLLALPFVPALTVAGIEKDSPKLAFFFITVAALICGARLLRLDPPLRRTGLLRRPRRRGRPRRRAPARETLAREEPRRPWPSWPSPRCGSATASSSRACRSPTTTPSTPARSTSATTTTSSFSRSTVTRSAAR